MTVHDVFQHAIAGGYELRGLDGVTTSYSGANSEYSVWTRTDNGSSFMIRVEETLLDPTFWTCAFGTQGRALALALVEHLFDGGSVASFFRDGTRGRPATQRRLMDWFRRTPQQVHVYPLPEHAIA